MKKCWELENHVFLRNKVLGGIIDSLMSLSTDANDVRERDQFEPYYASSVKSNNSIKQKVEKCDEIMYIDTLFNGQKNVVI